MKHSDSSSKSAMEHELDELRREVRSLKAQLAAARGTSRTEAPSSEPLPSLPKPLDSSSQGFFRKILDCLPEQVSVFDAEGRFVYVNEKAVGDPRIREWMIGKSDEAYCRRRGRAEDVATRRRFFMGRAIESGEAVSFEEVVENDTERRHFLRIFTPIFYPTEGEPEPSADEPSADESSADKPSSADKLQWVLGYGMEVTEHRMLQEQLVQSQKLEAVGQLVSGVAHDFNNLLTALQGYGDLLMRTLEAGSREHRLASEVRKVTDKAGALTRRLLTYSRKRRPRPDRLDLNESVRDMGFLLERTLSESIELQLQLLPGKLGISIDGGQLQQLILNLALNGRDAMGGRGRLLISSNREAEVEREGQIFKGPWVVLGVEDEGEGIAADLHDKIFEPFFTTKDEDRGTGLGLSTVVGIARQNDGHVRLRSTPGEGSCFEVVFPEIRLDEGPPRLRSKAEPEVDEDGMETLLLVEDEDSVRELTAGFLRHLGYTVLEARDGLEALAISEDHPGRLDLVLSDVVMPRMGGPELARHLSPLRPRARWVFMSGYPDKARMPEVVGSDAPFLEKPFRPSQLGRTIRKVLDRTRPPN